MHLKGVERAMESIKGEETRVRGRVMVEEILGRWGARRGAQDGSGVVGGAVVASVSESAPKATETALVGVYGVGEHACEMGQEVEVNRSVDVVEEVTKQVEEIGGWPVRAKVSVTGLTPNRRMLKGKVGERWVTVERKATVKAGDVIEGKLMRAGAVPLYRAVG